MTIDATDLAEFQVQLREIRDLLRVETEYLRQITELLLVIKQQQQVAWPIR